MEINTQQYLSKFTVQKKETFEFQEIGKSMQKHFKENIWWIFHKFPLNKIKRAYDVCCEKEIYKLAYLLAVIHKL